MGLSRIISAISSIRLLIKSGDIPWMRLIFLLNYLWLFELFFWIKDILTFVFCFQNKGCLTQDRFRCMDCHQRQDLRCNTLHELPSRWKRQINDGCRKRWHRAFLEISSMGECTLHSSEESNWICCSEVTQQISFFLFTKLSWRDKLYILHLRIYPCNL